MGSLSNTKFVSLVDTGSTVCHMNIWALIHTLLILLFRALKDVSRMHFSLLTQTIDLIWPSFPVLKQFLKKTSELLWVDKDIFLQV